MGHDRLVTAKSAGIWYVYILRCADATLYTGVTNCVADRITAHNAGRGARYTRGRRPVKLVYREAVEGRSQALRREAEIKRLTAAEKRRLAGAAARV